jgi:hypothetical protein
MSAFNGGHDLLYGTPLRFARTVTGALVTGMLARQTGLYTTRMAFRDLRRGGLQGLQPFTLRGALVSAAAFSAVKGGTVLLIGEGAITGASLGYAGLYTFAPEGTIVPLATPFGTYFVAADGRCG